MIVADDRSEIDPSPSFAPRTIATSGLRSHLGFSFRGLADYASQLIVRRRLEAGLAQLQFLLPKEFPGLFGGKANEVGNLDGLHDKVHGTAWPDVPARNGRLLGHNAFVRRVGRLNVSDNQAGSDNRLPAADKLDCSTFGTETLGGVTRT